MSAALIAELVIGWRGGRRPADGEAAHQQLELALALGLLRDVVSKTVRLKSPATQPRLRDVLEIMTGAAWAGSVAQAFACTLGAAAVFGDQTAEDLSKAGPGGGGEDLSEPDRGRWLRLRLTRPVYRAHHRAGRLIALRCRGGLVRRRLNPAEVEALYTSLRLETPWLEAQQGFLFKAQPMMLCAYAGLRRHGGPDRSSRAERTRRADGSADLAWEDMAARGVRPPSWLLAED